MEVVMSSEKLMHKSAIVEAGTDLIVDTAAQIENLDKEGAFEMIKPLLSIEGENDFRLGGILSLIKSNGWWEDKGYESFKSFVVGDFDMQYRKAMYLIAMYNNLVESEVPWEKVAHIGWSKLKELAAVINNENVDGWVSKAETMTVIQLQEEIKKSTQGTLASNDMADTTQSTPITTLSMKVHEDQKENIKAAIDKAKHEAETVNDGVALDAICTNYLTGGATAKQKAPSLSAMMKEAGYEVVLENFEALWPNIDLTVNVSS